VLLFNSDKIDWIPLASITFNRHSGYGVQGSQFFVLWKVD